MASTVTAKKTVTSKTQEPKAKGLLKLVKPSKELAAIVGEQPLPRTEVTKKLWDYIKGQKLQDPSSKKTIVNDKKMKAVFEVDRIDMFAMTKALSKHLS